MTSPDTTDDAEWERFLEMSDEEIEAEWQKASAEDEVYRLRDLIDEIADMDIGDIEIEHREIIARCREEQKRWAEE